MPLEILIMIIAFMVGAGFQYLEIHEKFGKHWPQGAKIRSLVYQAVVFYLLFKIGFGGGKAVAAESWTVVLFPALLMILSASVWTLFVLLILKAWTKFPLLSQISIAAHFGSVSVGTFIAGLAFLSALGIEVSPTVAIWLALMELPAILIGMWKLGVKPKTLIQILKQEWSLSVLVLAILLGIFVPWIMPEVVSNFLFKVIFAPILSYFLFEMGRKALASFGQLQGRFGSIVLIGIVVPILGGVIGVSLGSVLGFTPGETFIWALLLASASYVLAPISMQEILKSLYHPKHQEAQEAISISMALSVGITLPFNILVGFEIYYLLIQLTSDFPSLAYIGLMLPIILSSTVFYQLRSR